MPIKSCLHTRIPKEFKETLTPKIRMFAFQENQHHKPLCCLMGGSVFFKPVAFQWTQGGKASIFLLCPEHFGTQKKSRQTFMLTIGTKYLNFNIHATRTHCSKNYPLYLYTLSHSCKHLSLCLFRNLTQTKVHWSNTLKTTGKGKYYC